MSTIRFTVTAILLFCSLTGKAQVPQLVKDIATGRTSAVFDEAIAFDGRLLFTSDAHPSTGEARQLWISDGTSAGTQLLKTFVNYARPHGFTILNDRVYFIANDSGRGDELWMTDGSSVNTQIVKDIYPGPQAGVSGNLVVLNGRIYFAGNDSAHGRELWTSDGTAAGTQLAVDIRAGQTGSDPSEIVVSNNKLFLTTNDGGNGQQLWTSDGSVANTSMVIHLSGGSGSGQNASMMNLVAANNKVYFTKWMNSGSFSFPVVIFCVSDGTAAGTTDLTSSLLNSEDYTVLSGKLYFYGIAYSNNFTQRGGLYVTDGTIAGTKPVKDTIGFSCGSGNSNRCMFLTVFNGRLYFAVGGMPYKNQLWSSDGTAAGTVLINDFDPGVVPTGTLHPMNMVVANNRLWFKAWDKVMNRCNLWSSDGTAAGTNAVYYPGATRYNYDLCSELYLPITVVDSFLYYGMTYDTATTGTELYKLQIPLAAKDPILANSRFRIYPSPATDVLNISCDIDNPTYLDIDIIGIDGKTVQALSRNKFSNSGHTVLSYPIGELMDGVYLVRITTPLDNSTRKLVVHRK